MLSVSNARFRFLGTAGQAIVTTTNAYFITDSRYWLQAKQQLDNNWELVQAGGMNQPKDWIEWLVVSSGTPSYFTIVSSLHQDQVHNARIGIDARMISHEKATLINSKLSTLNSKLIYPPQNLVDLVWKDKPSKPKAPIFIQPIEFTGMLSPSLSCDTRFVSDLVQLPGMDASVKLGKLRDWIRSQPPSVPSYSRSPPTLAQMQSGTLITSLSCIGRAAP